MSPEAQQIAIAQACGWTIENACGSWVGKPKCEVGPMDDLPDYLNDLNAMHQAEKVLMLKEKQYFYAVNLLAVFALNNPPVEETQHGRAFFIAAHASAAQRAEAFLRTLGLWQDGGAR